MVTYRPLAGVKVLDLGILIPAALTSGKLAALGADVVKVEQPPVGIASAPSLRSARTGTAPNTWVRTGASAPSVSTYAIQATAS